MRTWTARFFALVAAVAAWELFVRPWLVPASPARAQPADKPKDNDELAKMYKEDQDDRRPAGGKPIDWEKVEPRDRAREARVKELFKGDKLQTAADFYHAAMVLQHAPQPDDYLLAHEFCVVAAAKGEKRALWLAAASEDRFLMNLKRPQRFGTQYRSEQGGAIKLYETDPIVTDALRREYGVPTLADAKAREAKFNEPPKKE